MTRRRLALAAILLVGVAYATMIQSFSWNQTSHYDLTRALNQDKTTIDQYAANTGDKVEYKGHTYSARAPGLALFVLPFYNALNVVNAESWTDAHVAPPNHPGDEMIYLIGLWGNVLPGLLLLVLVWRVAERYEPGYGAAAAVVLGLGGPSRSRSINQKAAKLRNVVKTCENSICENGSTIVPRPSTIAVAAP